ncbi:ubiquitin carrier protein, partial [Trifolium medium]|nr:ubiquitin carrier protein [Trifolium medium]
MSSLTSKFSEYCEKYAKPEDIGAATEEKSSDEEDEELTEDEYDSSDEQIAALPSGNFQRLMAAGNYRGPILECMADMVYDALIIEGHMTLDWPPEKWLYRQLLVLSFKASDC